MKKYVLDTNLYVRAFRSREAATELAQFYSHSAPGMYLSSIVLHELLVGSNTDDKIREVKERIARPLQRIGRLFTPSHSAWEIAGEAVARMAREERTSPRSVPKSLIHDFLLAASCREAGVVLVTGNVKDFERIGRYFDFSFVASWPS